MQPRRDRRASGEVTKEEAHQLKIRQNLILGLQADLTRAEQLLAITRADLVAYARSIAVRFGVEPEVPFTIDDYGIIFGDTAEPVLAEA